MENTIKNSKKADELKDSRPGGFTRFLASLLDGTILTRDNMGSVLGYALFLTMLAIVLIFNTYYAEKKARRMEAMRIEVVELRLRYVSTKSELMALSNQSAVARSLQGTGLVESTTPPRQIPGITKRGSLISGIWNKKNRQ